MFFAKLLSVASLLLFISAAHCEETIIKTVSFTIADSCVLTEPLYNQTFDLTPLRSDASHVVTSAYGGKFNFNVCGSIPNKCNGRDNVGACLTTGSHEIVIGSNSTLSFHDGRILFNFTGDHCADNLNYTLGVLLMCDYVNTKDPITAMPHNNGDCSYFIMWKTKHACLAFDKLQQTSNCAVKNPVTGKEINLMSLSDDNHKIPDRNGSDFLINICKPVLYGYDAMCPPGSSICFVNKNAKDLRQKFLNYGTTVPSPLYENEELIMRFTSPEKCNSTHNFISSILFFCDANVKYEEPEYYGLDGCHHRFVWATPVACNINEPCVATNNVSGQRFDMSSLAGKQYKVVESDKEYVFGICKSAEAPCLEQTGICRIDNGQSTSLGIVNNNLQLNGSGTPYLSYKSGSVCKNISNQWTTRIEFICSWNEYSKAVIVENTDCEIVIHFLTALACTDQISCRAYNLSDETSVDLTPLISTSSNYLARVNDTLKPTEGTPIQFFINVCHPLVPQYGLSCKGGSAACRAIEVNGTYKEEKSLGFPDVSLTIVDTDHGSRAQLKYFRGDSCPSDKLTELSTTFEFYCDTSAGRGTPILQEILHDCHYVFDWPTNVICPSHPIDFIRDKCEIFNGKSNDSVDLRQIFGNGKLSLDDGPDTLNIDLCQMKHNVEIDYKQENVKTSFTVNGPCKDQNGVLNKNATIHVRLSITCEDSTDRYTPYNHSKSCYIEVIQNTPLICPLLDIDLSKRPPPSQSQDVIKPDVTTGAVSAIDDRVTTTSTTKIVFIIMSVGIALAAIAFLYDPTRRSKIRALFRRRNVSVQYTRVSGEEANLLMPQPGSLTDSDDDLMI